MAIDLRDYSRTAAQRGWGAGWPSCGGAKTAGTAVVTAERSGTRMSVHKRLARLVDLLIDETERRGYLLKPGQCGGYNCRAIAGTGSPSNHSWGLAVDVNWQDNPYTTDLSRNTIPDWMVELWNRCGFAWGGHYAGARKDFMHFEFMGSPADADEMTALALREPPAQEDDMPSAQDIARAVWEHPVTNAWGQVVPAGVVLIAHEGISADTRSKVEALAADSPDLGATTDALSGDDVERIAVRVAELLSTRLAG